MVESKDANSGRVELNEVDFSLLMYTFRSNRPEFIEVSGHVSSVCMSSG